MNNKIISLSLVCMFLFVSFSSISVVKSDLVETSDDNVGFLVTNNGGTIVVNGVEYGHGDTAYISAGTYSLSANIKTSDGHIFGHWDGQPQAFIQIGNIESTVTTVSIDERGGFIYLFCKNVAPTKPSTPTGSQTVNRNQESTYSTSANDVNGDKLQYGWDWNGDYYVDTWDNNNGEYYPRRETISTSHSWSEPGTYEVRVKARDDDALGGWLDSEWSEPFSVTVNNVQPNTPGTPIGPTEGAKGIEYSFKTKTTDPESDKVKFGWDWNEDDIVDEWTRDFLIPGTYRSIKHTFTEAKTHNIQVLAEDEFGAQSSFSSKLSISIRDNSAPYKPSPPNGQNTGRPGIEYSFSTSTTDPDGDSIEYLFDWDDGTESGWGADTRNHKWDSPGTYSIIVKAKDSLGESSSWSETHQIDIFNNAPFKPSTPVGTLKGSTRQKYTFSTSTTDPDGDEIKYLFDWGDGTNSGWISSSSVSHEWKKQGSYQVKVKAKDDFGAESPWSDPAIASMPKSRPTMTNILERLIELFPNINSILQFFLNH